MDSVMKVLQYILLGLVMLVFPLMPSLALLGLSLFYFKKHDWRNSFFRDKWGALGILSFLLGVAAYVILFMPTQL